MSTEQELAELTASTTALTVEVAGKSAALTAKVDAASASANAASTSESIADQHRIDALAAKDASLVSEVAAEQFKNESKNYRDESLSYRDQAETFKDQAEIFKDDAELAAQTFLPTLQDTYDNGTSISINDADGSVVLKSSRSSNSLEIFSLKDTAGLQQLAITGGGDILSNSSGKEIFKGIGNNSLAIADAASTVIINGNLVVSGTTTTLDAENVSVKDRVITINSGDAGPGVTGGSAGIEVYRGPTTPKYTFTYEESTQSFKIGEEGNLQPVATREGSPLNNAVATWDAVNSKFRTDAGLTYQSGELDVSGNAVVGARLVGGVGASETGGVLDWNDASNSTSGSGNTLLSSTAANKPPSSVFFHPFTFEYSSKDGTGNVTQFAIPYGYNVGINEGIYFRGRFEGTWSSWAKLVSENLSGNVGIGVIGADSKLHVQSGNAGTVSAIGSTTLTLESSASNYLSMLSPDGSGRGIVFGSPSNSAQAGIYYTGTSSDELQFRNSGNQTKMSLTSEGNLELLTGGKGVVLKSPNGTRYRLSVDDSGNLVTTAV